MTEVGKVFLVGAGPGDPGLLTLKALDCLRHADLILYDGLVNPLVLRHTHAHAERTCRSSGPQGLRLDQEEINQRLIEAANEGKNVVRLKGGDPFIFGRGSEEAEALRDAGIAFEVVPGITAATAASECAGISLTHRDHASAVAFITGHEGDSKEDSSLDYTNLAQFPGTLVFYMGLHRLEFIVESLLAAGKLPDTPAAVISRASTYEQRTVTSNLSDLIQDVRAAELHAPSLIVVGDCVRMRDRIAWFEQRPLFGKRIGITRPEAQCGPVIDRVVDFGGQPVVIPCIEILPPGDWSAVDEMIGGIAGFDWLVFTSVNGVSSFFDRLWSLGHDARLLAHARIAAIGTSTAEALAELHLRADVVPDTFRAEALAEALVPHVDGKNVLWIGASRGRDVLPTTLESAGARVEKLVVYRNEDAASIPEDSADLLVNGQIDWVGLSSPSIARSFANLLDPETKSHIGTKTKLASISPVTSEAAREVGLPISAEAETYTWDGILDAIVGAERD